MVSPLRTPAGQTATQRGLNVLPGGPGGQQGRGFPWNSLRYATCVARRNATLCQLWPNRRATGSFTRVLAHLRARKRRYTQV